MRPTLPNATRERQVKPERRITRMSRACPVAFSQNAFVAREQLSRRSKGVKRVTCRRRAMSNSPGRDSDKGKATERWRRKVTGLKSDRLHGSGTARIPAETLGRVGPFG